MRAEKGLAGRPGKGLTLRDFPGIRFFPRGGESFALAESSHKPFNAALSSARVTRDPFESENEERQRESALRPLTSARRILSHRPLRVLPRRTLPRSQSRGCSGPPLRRRGGAALWPRTKRQGEATMQRQPSRLWRRRRRREKRSSPSFRQSELLPRSIVSASAAHFFSPH